MAIVASTSKLICRYLQCLDPKRKSTGWLLMRASSIDHPPSHIPGSKEKQEISMIITTISIRPYLPDRRFNLNTVLDTNDLLSMLENPLDAPCLLCVSAKGIKSCFFSSVLKYHAMCSTLPYISKPPASSNESEEAMLYHTRLKHPLQLLVPNATFNFA